jgi:transcriptional regulator with AAA-type ATPase domain/polyferredoxin
MDSTPAPDDRNANTLLSEEVLEYLHRVGSEQSFPEGAAIVHRGSPGEAFYVVLEGTAEVRVPAGDDGHLPVVRLSPGASFGEMALLRGAPVSADVIALDRVTVLEVPEERFERALAECAPLRRELLTRMAENIHQTTSDALGLFLRASTLDKLMRRDWVPVPVVAESARMQNVLREVQELAGVDDPVLVTGADGTGKLFVARLIHEADDLDAPFFVVDCRSVVPEEASRFILGSDSGRAGRIGEGRIGALHMAHQGTLVLRHVDRLPHETQAAIADYIRTISEDGSVPLPRVRILATATSTDGRAAPGVPLESGLAEVLTRRVLPVPTLIQRRFDILPLARLFLDQARGDRALSFTSEAEDALLSCRYSHRNAAELREAVEVATLFADGDQIRREHIFTGPRSEQALPEADVGTLAPVRALWRNVWLLPALRWGVLASFTAVILLCLLAGQTVLGRLANGTVWVLWEPTIIVLFLFAGHVWCTVCPLSTAGTVVQRLGSLNRAPPAWAKKYGGWIMLAGFFLIVWSERFFHMTSTPLASGVLLATLIGASVLMCLVYQREVWCRYLCPLGALASGYSSAATLSVRANPSVCASRCTTHECYKGTATEPGCPVYHHPLYANEAHVCKLCLGCLDRCPYESVKLYLRPPLMAVWRVGYAAATLVPFALGVFLLALVLLGSQGSGWMAERGGVTVLGLLAVVAGVLLAFRLPRMVAHDLEPASPVVASVAFALLVLGWGPLMAYQVGNIPLLTRLFVGARPGVAELGVAGFGVSLLPLAQLGFIALATAMALFSLWRIRVQARKAGIVLKRSGWVALGALCVGYVAAAVVLVVASVVGG